jgi:hypothetical protein
MGNRRPGAIDAASRKADQQCQPLHLARDMPVRAQPRATQSPHVIVRENSDRRAGSANAGRIASSLDAVIA